MFKKISFVNWDFKILENNVLFYDPNETSEFSQYIEENLEEIKQYFFDNCLWFRYLPDVCSQITNEKVKYNFPGWNNEPLQKLGNNALKRFLPEGNNIGACLFKKVFFENKYYCYELKPLSEMSWEEQVERFIEDTRNDYRIQNRKEIRFSVAEADISYDAADFPVFEKEYYIADGNFNYTNIDDNIREVIDKLKGNGVEQFVLRLMVPIEEKLSKMIITPDYDILLPDYGNMPIEMSPLPKAVFLLFLKHKDGIYFKDLPDYRAEIQSIYEKITNRVSDAVISESLDKVTNPMDNAINEKCSRIREAFLKRMDERVAEHYYITGKRGMKKKIALPKKFIEMQCEI